MHEENNTLQVKHLNITDHCSKISSMPHLVLGRKKRRWEGTRNGGKSKTGRGGKMR